MKIAFIIRSLELAGAERQLVLLANGLADAGHDVSVVVLYPGGALERELKGVRLMPVPKKGRWDVTFLFKLARVLREIDPDVVHGYLGLGNLLSALSGLLLRRTRVVWGVRASYVDLDRYDRGARISFELERKLSRLADLIIANSEAGKEYAASIGYPAGRIRVVRNGIDAGHYAPSTSLRHEFRQQHGIGDDDVVFGMVGRVDVMKGHDLFLQAASRIAAEDPSVRFVCVGRNDTPYGRGMADLGRALPHLAERLVWLPATSDVRSAYNGIDVLVSASRFGEGFPNVIGEAMACGVPCVATRVGDAAHVMGGAGLSVPVDDGNALTAAMRQLLGSPDERSRMGEAARKRIAQHFQPEHMIRSTEQELHTLIGRQR